MKKQIKKWFTFSLALMLIMGSINYSPLRANATAESTISGNDAAGTTNEDGGDVSENGVSGNDAGTVSGNSASESGEAQMLSTARLMTANLVDDSNILDGDAIGGDRTEDKYLYANSDAFSSIGDRWSGSTDYYERDDVNKTVTITTSSKYTELLFTLGEAIEASNVEAVSFAMSEYTGAWAYKVYVDGAEKYTNYDVNAANATDKNIVTIPISETEGSITAIAVMSNTADSAECTFDGIMINMVAQTGSNILDGEAIGGDKTKDKYLYANSDAFSSIGDRWSGSTDYYEKDDVNKTITITTSEKYKELLFKLAEPVEASKVESISFAMSEYTGAWAYKVYVDGAEKYTNYDVNAANATDKNIVTIPISETEGNITAIAVMSNTADSAECTFDGIMIDMKGTSDINVEKYTITVFPSALNCDYHNTTTAELTEDKRFNIVFSDTANNEARLVLPANINMADCESITFNVKEQTGAVNFNLWLNKDKKGNFYYNTGKTSYVLTSSNMSEDPAYAGEIDAVGVQISGSAEKIVLDSVVFTMKKTGNEENKTYGEKPIDQEEPSGEEKNITPAGDGVDDISLPATAENMSNYYNNTDVKVTGPDDLGRWSLTLPENYQQSIFELSEAVDLSKCSNVTFAVSSQDGSLAFRMYTADDKDSWSSPVLAQWGKSGQTEYTFSLSNVDATVKYISISSNEKAATCTFDGVMFEVDTTSKPDEPITGTENITPAGDGVDDLSYKAAALSVVSGSSATYQKTTTDQFKIGFASQYNELKLTLPETVDMLQCKAVTFAVSSQDAPLAFKLYNADNEEVFVKYDQKDSQLYNFEVSSSEKVKYIGVMLNQNLSKKSCIFDGVMFELDKKATTETYTVTYTANELTLDSSGAESCNLVNGKYMIQFSDMDQNVNFKLPASVNLEKCVNITFNVASQMGPMNFNVGLDKTKLKDYWYNTGKTSYTVEPGITSKINEVGVQCGRENDAYVSGSFIELVSVSFLMKGTAPKDTPADNNYSMDYFEVAAQNDSVTFELNEYAAAEITFPDAGDSITLLIPDSVDVNHLVSIDFYKTAEFYSPASTLSASMLSGKLFAKNLFASRTVGSAPEISVEILDADMHRIVSTLANSVETHCNPEARYIRLTSNTPNTLVTISSIRFNVDPAAFEAIVLNGNFAREDVTMWGAALWGSVEEVPTAITAKTSDTAIFDDVYTYGEVNRRSSPYVCFAQNVTERTTPGSGYAFSFWAKLSDDYAGAPAEQRTIEFSPYYFDANGRENYNMTRTGTYQQVLEPGVWTYFSGVVGLPGDATGFVIRIVEQGTNYGKGQCVLGSYAVTGVSLSPAAYPPAPSYGGGGGGGSYNPVITKEATCEVGYAFKDLAVDWASATTSIQDNKLKVSFVNQYDEARLKLPRTLDMSTCAYIKVSVASQNVPIAVKLYRKGQQVDVAYYNDIKTSYLMVPAYTGLIDAIGIMSLATPNPANANALVDGITFGLTKEPAPEEVSDTIVLNGDFEDEDLSDWYEALWGDGVTITRQISSQPIFGNTNTYATISRRTSPYQCFAQDITKSVKQNGTYAFSFWAKLSDDYKGAPENQRVVQFAPYTVDASGNADYNPKLDGTYSQVLQPGVWTYFEGTYKVTNANPISKVVIRILEQGTNYGQGDCVMGSFSIAGVHMEKYIPIPPEIDEDVPNLKDAMAETFGNDFVTGTAVTLDELDDPGIELLINKHFSAVTLGNELKPDALFNYSNDKHTPLKTITFNGQKLEVPTLYFSRADEILDKLLQWNQDHQDNPIQVRGHVLVWHSQTPEWFFREGYTVGQNADGSENYVTPEVMNLRMEWYIKSVLEHYTGEKSPYKDLFYGWDVVNEAVNNGGSGYRTDRVSAIEPLSQSTHSSNSSWWAVYQSNEYIINAFRFANQYAPADLELYYNDYNECDSKKVKGIVTLLKDVKEAEGTRIDGMGMQGHYQLHNPTISDIESAIRAYAEVVGQVQITELDLKASTDINNEKVMAEEYAKQAEHYHNLYMLLQKLDAEDGIEIGGVTFWGTVDKYSWLQSRSGVGGGSDGLLPQCPLLFDSNYRVKPAYWAFVDYSMVSPDWDKEPEPEVTEQPQKETTESVSESKPVVAEPETEVTAEKKSSPFIPIAVAVGVAAVAGVGGTAVYLGKRKKSNGGKSAE